MTDRKGSLMYTRDGRMSVQIQFPESQSSVSNDYISNGYEASFGTYEVNEASPNDHTPRRGIDHARPGRTEPDARVPVL